MVTVPAFPASAARLLLLLSISTPVGKFGSGTFSPGVLSGTSGLIGRRFGPGVVVSVPTLNVMSPAGAAPVVSAETCVPLRNVTLSAVMVMFAGALALVPPLTVAATVA